MKKSYCKNFTAVLVSEPQNTNDMLVARARCKKWDCDYCARINQRMWRGYLNSRINELGGQWSFMTLTGHPAAHKNGWTLANLRDAWKPVYDKIRNSFAAQKPIEYIRMFEKHKSGEFHIHVLWRIDLNPFTEMNDWLKDAATSHGLGWRVDWRAIPQGTEAQKIAMYITKYMTKDAQGLGNMPRGLRRIQTSQGIGAMKPVGSDDVWRVKSGVYEEDVKHHDHVIDVSTGELITDKYFRFNWIYPQEYQDADDEQIDRSRDMRYDS
jgi:hypothetical protein